MKARKRLKKRLEDFIKDESGFISKDKIMKIGLGTVSVLGIMGAFSSNLIAGHSSHDVHNNALSVTPDGNCARLSHGSHANHANHNSY